jgi:hypothetical protein
MALNSFAQQDTVNPEAVQPRFLNDDDREGFSVRAHAFLLSSEKRASSAAISPADTLCFDIFSPRPGDSDVASQVDRLSSNEIILRKDRPRSWSVPGLISYVLHGRLQSGW